MNKDISTAIGQLDRYLARIKRDIRAGDYSQALADTAELSEIARRLWNKLRAEVAAGASSARATESLTLGAVSPVSAPPLPER